jgi:2-polyprenyl-3-methyl-5-hydroxy-6-metoxy-1,4-benzoquinol methylase
MRNTATNAILRKRLAKPNISLIEQIRKAKWTSHNIPLSASEATMGSEQPLIGDDVRVNLIKENLYAFLGNGADLSGFRLIDLGCLEGGLSFEMAREDMEVLGVEGRMSNFEKCSLVKKYFQFPNLNFIHQDVKLLNHQEHGLFDVILCCGILYHLDNPICFLQLLNELTHQDSLLFLDTHIAPSAVDYEKCIYRKYLSATETLLYDGMSYAGRWFMEYPEELNESSEEWAAVSNYRSFWLTYASLMEAIYRAGFERIYSLHGGFEIKTEFDLKEKYSRLYCVAVKKNFFKKYLGS